MRLGMIGAAVAVVVSTANVQAVPKAASAEPAIMAAMADSAAGWNANDLDRFLAVYSPDAAFVTSKGLITGRAAIAARYRSSYMADGKLHGTLTFQPKGFRQLSAVHAILWARYTLTYAEGKPPQSGPTTLVFERRPEGWRIISDHSG